jgi:hypothetical protein
MDALTTTTSHIGQQQQMSNNHHLNQLHSRIPSSLDYGIPEQHHHQQNMNNGTTTTATTESHIYSHIYDPSSVCGCPSCDRLSPSASSSSSSNEPQRHHHHLNNVSNNTTGKSILEQLGFIPSSSAVESALAFQSTTGVASTMMHHSKKKKMHCMMTPASSTLRPTSINLLHHPHSLHHMSLGRNYLSRYQDPTTPYTIEPTSSFTDKILNCFSGSSMTTKTEMDFDPIEAELEKRRRKKCLLLSLLFTIALVIGIFLVTSFVLFTLSSYREYHSQHTSYRNASKFFISRVVKYLCEVPFLTLTFFPVSSLNISLFLTI